MDFTGYTDGDDITFEYHLPTIATDAQVREGEVTGALTTPQYGAVLFISVELPTRTVEYELRADPDDEGEQVVKRLPEKDDGHLGSFGPLTEVR